jgi:bidirectional [NiFe] hydrogenase diaphorase subunit
MAAVTAAAGAQPAGGDKRFRILEGTMRRHHYRPDALIEVLHSAQELFGFLSDDLLRLVARALRVPPSRVYGVATFYGFFSLRPRGAHTCVVCMGTACYVKGAAAVLAAIEAAHGVTAGGTTADGTLSLLTARCVGACGVAPAVIFDDAIEGKITPDAAEQRMSGWWRHDG